MWTKTVLSPDCFNDMNCEILKGAPVAQAIDEETLPSVIELKSRGINPCVAILRVGERKDDISYERAAAKRCDKLGIGLKSVVLKEDVSQREVLFVIEGLNADREVDGILMFRPLPKSLNEKELCSAISPKKDIDGVTAGSMAKVYSGVGEGFAPCTAQSCIEILKYYGVELKGKRVAVIGRSLVIGRPAAMLLMGEDATVTLCHSKTPDIPSIAKNSDIIIAALGKGESIDETFLAPGQTVIDVGISWCEEKGKLVGDVAFEKAANIVSAITPVPGGVGSVTTAVLLRHVVEAAKGRGN